MISGQTLRVCREEKPVPTFPDHALALGPPAIVIPRGKLLVPPASAHGYHQLNRVLIALRLRANIAELGLLKLPLNIEQPDNARAAVAIADTLQTHSL